MIFAAFVIFWIFALSQTQSFLESLSSQDAKERVNQVSVILVQSSGILIGFIGVSAFFFFGKLGDLITSTYKQALKTASLLAKCEIHIKHSLQEITRIEYELSSRSDSEEKELKDFRKDAQDTLQAIDVNKSENEKLTKTMKKELPNATQITLLIATIEIVFLAISLILCLEAIIGGEASYLMISMYFFGVGIGFIVMGLYTLGDIFNGLQDILNDLMSMNTKLTGVYCLSESVHKGLERIRAR